MALSYSVDFSVKARQELLDMCGYIERTLMNPSAAADLADKVSSSAESLSYYPKRYRVRGKDSRGREMRYMPVKNVVLMYCVDDETRAVNISRVIYARRNIDAML